MTSSLRYLFSPLFAAVLGMVLLLGAPARAQAPGWQAVTASTTLLTPGLIYPDGASVAATATDAAGNVFLAGSFSSTVVFGPATLVAVGGGVNTFVAKWSAASGAFAWALQTSTTASSGNDIGTSLAVSGGNVYVGGTTFTTNTSFGSRTVTQPFNGSSAYVAKVTDAGNSGSFVWVQTAAAGIGSYAEFSALAVSGTSVYVSGYMSGSTLAFNPSQASLFYVDNSEPAQNATDLFVAKLTDAGATGSFVWGQGAGGRGFDRAPALAVNGNYVYVAGFTNYAATFGTLSIGSSTVRQDRPFLARLFDAGPSGAFTWAAQVATSTARPAALALNGTALYLALQYTGAYVSGTTTLPNAGGSHSLVGKFSDTGVGVTQNWLAPGGSATLDDAPTSLAVRGGYVYVAGTFNGPSATFGASTLTTTSPANTPNLYLARLTDAGSAGTYNWAQQAVGSSAVSGRGLGFGFVGVALSGTRVLVAGAVKPPATFGTQTVTSAFAAPVAFVTAATDPALALLPTLNAFAPTSGSVGTAVTLTGTNLGTVTDLTLNYQPITGFTANAAGTSLSFTIPAGALSGAFAVSTPTGTATAPGSFCVLYTPTTTGANICGRGTATLQASGGPAAGGAYAFYAAATGGPALPGSSSGSFTTPVLSTTTTYYVGVRTGTGNLGCEGTRTPVTATVSPVAFGYAGPAVSFCAGGSAQLGATFPPEAGTSYQYSPATGLSNAAILSPTVTLSTPGAYTYTLTSTNTAGCSVTSQVVVTVLPVPAAPTVSRAPVAGGVQLTSSVPTGNQWYLDGVLIAGATGASYVANGAGTYTVVATAANGCASAPSGGQVVVLATASAARAAQVQLYPNPASGQVSLTLPTAATVRVHNALGQLLYQRTLTAATPNILTLAGLARGVYTVQVVLGSNEVVTKRLVLE